MNPDVFERGLQRKKGNGSFEEQIAQVPRKQGDDAFSPVRVSEHEMVLDGNENGFKPVSVAVKYAVHFRLWSRF